EEETGARLWRPGVQAPGAGPFADGIPGPHRVAVDALHQFHLRLDAAGAAADPHPIVVIDTKLGGTRPVQVQPVGAMDLAQPGVLRAPGMVHGHRPLRDGKEREITLAVGALEWRIPKG